MTTASFQTSPPRPFSAPSDDLAAVVVRRLEKRPAKGSWGLFQTIILGIPSFGLIPLLTWPARFRDYAADETHAMQELAQWAKMRGRQPAAVGPLLSAAEDTAVSPIVFILSLLLATLVVGVFIIQFSHVDFSIENLLGWTYLNEGGFNASTPISHPDFAYRVWVVALSIGYLVQFLHVRAHDSDVKRFVERFNPIAEAEGLPAIRLRFRGWAYFRPLWILAAVLLAVYHAWWGIPLILAGMAQRRYTQITSRGVRRELAKRVKDVVTLRQMPVIYVPVATPRCVNPRCMAPLKPYSRFCARCGGVNPEARRA